MDKLWTRTPTDIHMFISRVFMGILKDLQKGNVVKLAYVMNNTCQHKNDKKSSGCFEQKLNDFIVERLCFGLSYDKWRCFFFIAEVIALNEATALNEFTHAVKGLLCNTSSNTLYQKNVRA